MRHIHFPLNFFRDVQIVPVLSLVFLLSPLRDDTQRPLVTKMPIRVRALSALNVTELI